MIESIFKTQAKITRQEMCLMLNLNPDKEDLTETEIKKAYKLRALRFHPDKQFSYPESERIPEEYSSLFLEDFQRARDHLINHDDIAYGDGQANDKNISVNKAIALLWLKMLFLTRQIDDFVDDFLLIQKLVALKNSSFFYYMQLVPSIILAVGVMISNIGLQLAFWSGKYSLDVITNAYDFISAFFNFDEEPFGHSIMKMTASLINIFVRIPTLFALDVTNVLVRFFTGFTGFESLKNLVDSTFESLLSSKDSELQESNLVGDGHDMQLVAVGPVQSHDVEGRIDFNPSKDAGPGFFASNSASAFNEKDTWLEKVLEDIKAENLEAQSEQATFDMAC